MRPRRTEPGLQRVWWKREGGLLRRWFPSSTTEVGGTPFASVATEGVLSSGVGPGPLGPRQQRWRPMIAPSMSMTS
jgi:hypothetical protein